MAFALSLLLTRAAALRPQDLNDATLNKPSTQDPQLEAQEEPTEPTASPNEFAAMAVDANGNLEVVETAQLDLAFHQKDQYLKTLTRPADGFTAMAVDAGGNLEVLDTHDFEEYAGASKSSDKVQGQKPPAPHSFADASSVASTKHENKELFDAQEQQWVQKLERTEGKAEAQEAEQLYEEIMAVEDKVKDEPLPLVIPAPEPEDAWLKKIAKADGRDEALEAKHLYEMLTQPQQMQM